MGRAGVMISWLALLAIGLGAAGAPWPGADAWAQSALSLPELREIRNLRDAREARQPEQVVALAEAYLKHFPEGRYRDEAMLGVAEAHQATGQPEKALADYDRLIDSLPDSAFREQALVNSLPLLQSAGQHKKAAQRLASLRREYPHSLLMRKVVLWQARLLFEQKDFQAAALLLKGEGIPEAGLSETERTEWLRLEGWSLLHLGRQGEAWPVFAKYLQRHDEMGHKVPVLMQLAEASRAAGAPGQALDYYQQVIGRFPHPSYLGEALFRRAELFVLGASEKSADGIAPADIPQALSYFDAYLATGDAKFLAPTLKGRAELLAQSGRSQEALADYSRLATLGENHRLDPELLRRRAELLVKLDRSGEAANLLKAAMASSALSREARAPLAVALAAVYYDRRDCPQVARALHPMPVFPDSGLRKRAFFLRGSCYFHGGEWEKASFDLEGLIADPAYQSQVWEPLLTAYERSGQWTRLANAGEILVASDGVGPREEILLKLAHAYQQIGQPEMLLSVFDRLAAVNPGVRRNPKLRLQLGLAEEAMGKGEKAEAHYLAVLGFQETPLPEFLNALVRLQKLLIARGDYSRLEKIQAEAEARFPQGAAREQLERNRVNASVAWAVADAKAGNHASALKKFKSAESFFKTKLKTTKISAEHDSVARDFAALYLAWAEAVEPTTKAAEVDARYREALALLPNGDTQARWEIARQLDARYAAAGDTPARAKLLEPFHQEAKEPIPREELRVKLLRLFLEWGKNETVGNHYKTALDALKKGSALLLPSEKELHYEFTAAMGGIYLATGDFSALTIEYERILPELQQPQLKKDVTQFLGQVYLTWAQRTEKKEKNKSVLTRGYSALANLPPHDLRNRSAATDLLVRILNGQKFYSRSAKLLEDLISQLPEGEQRQRYMLDLSSLYLEKIKKRSVGWKWLTRADLGKNDPASLEAGYRMAVLEMGAKRKTNAIKRLEGLVARGIQGSHWRIPVHYQLAVLYHDRKALNNALAHYHEVTTARSRELSRRYSKLIQQARLQEKSLKDYLRLGGGAKARGIAVPKVNP